MATVSSGCGGVKDGFPLIDRSHHDAEAETEAFSWRSSCSLFCSHGGGSRKAAAAAIDEDKFSPIGLHVLVVDSDTLCLAVLERMLRLCDYNVTACTRVSQAISFVMENRHNFDIVITDVHLPGEDGFKLLEVVGIGFGLPVIMMSTNGETNVVMRSITGGASDYLIKPIRMEELSTIWQHVVRRHRQHYHHHNIKDNHGDWSVRGRVLGKSKKGKQSCGQVIKDLSSLKTARVHWTAQLHRQFVKAVNQTGLDNAAPKRILEIMNIEGLTRENVASHLQKYRLYLMRLSGSNWESRPVASFQAARNGKSSGTMQIRQHAKTTPSSSLLSSSSSVLKETASYRSTNVHVDQGYESGAELHKITYVGWLRKNLQGGGGHRATPVHAYSAAQSSKVNFTELEETKPLPKLLGPSAHQPQLIQCAAPTAKTLEENGVDKEKVQRSIDQEELLFNNLVEEEFFCVKVPPDLDQMPTLIAAAGNLSEEGYFMFGDALLLKPG